MLQEYTITQVSAQEPRKWPGPKGDVFYIKVKLEGHDRPVSIGKRAPDALHVGDTVYGTIVSDYSHDEDKFKPEQKPHYAGASTPTTGKPAYTPRDDLAIRAQWAIGQANSVIENPAKNAEKVEDYAVKMFAMVDRVKEGGIAPVPDTQTEIDEDVAAAINMFTKEEGPF